MRWTEHRGDVVAWIAIQIRYAYRRPEADPWTAPPESISFLAGLTNHKEADLVLLDAIDALLGHSDVLEAVRRGRDTYSPLAAWEELDRLLDIGGSAWRVGPGHDQLVRRIDDAVQQVADTAAQHASQSASGHLAAAWSAVYGRRPDPHRAYAEAVLAIEATAPPVVTPKDPKASLGKAIATLRDTRASWKLPGGDAIDPVLDLMNQLWTRHPRHAATARDVDQDEAEGVVHAAAYLVHLFSRGLIRRR